MAMGSNSTTTHQSYAIAPTAPTSQAMPNGGGGAPDTTSPNVTSPPGQSPKRGSPSTGPDAPEAVPPEEELDRPAQRTPTTTGDTSPPSTPEPTQSDIDESGGAPLIPVPTALVVGDPVGAPTLVGGADLIDSTATLTAYASTDGPREVLHATVDPEAEAKLLDALDLSGNTIAVQVEQDVTGRLPTDKDNSLYEQAAAAARQANRCMKKGQPFPQTLIADLDSISATLDAIESNPARTPAEHAMVEHYRTAVNAIRDRLDGTTATPYAAGGKIPMVSPHMHAGTTLVTRQTPAPPDPNTGLVQAQQRKATRLAPALNHATGEASWDGAARRSANGTEFEINLGDGYTAVYRPYDGNDPATTDFSLRGQLEIIAPPGTGHTAELVSRLGQLHLVNRPMTAAEGEWTYLRRNITAQNLEAHPAVTASLKATRGYDDLAVQELFYQRAPLAAGLDERGLARFAKDIQLEAAARALPYKVTAMRDAVAAATGHPTGAALAATAGYDPTPTRSGGWLTWTRFDVTTNPEVLHGAFTGRRLVHDIGSGNLAAVLKSGVLASTERRATMGVAADIGQSEGTDKHTGGARNVFLRVRQNKGGVGPTALVWNDPAPLLRRADYWGANRDVFGAENPNSSKYSAKARTRDPHKIAKFSTAGSNEVMFRDGIDLLGPEGPDEIRCASTAHRANILQTLADKGISHLRGRPVGDVVTTHDS